MFGYILIKKADWQQQKDAYTELVAMRNSCLKNHRLMIDRVCRATMALEDAYKEMPKKDNE